MTIRILAVVAAFLAAAPGIRGAAGGGQNPIPPPIPPGPGAGVVATPVFGLRDVDAGSFHTCGIERGQRAWCWGLNDRGQLGVGVLGFWRHNPVEVATFHRYRQISAGGYGFQVAPQQGGPPRFESHTCGVTSAGTIDCWGANGFGQLGNGSFDDAAVPIPIFAPGVTFLEVSAGGLHTCALSDDFDVYCWGDNFSGQLGEDTGFLPTPIPLRASNAGRFTSLSAGGLFTCGSNPHGTECWGNNIVGQLGSGVAGGSSISPVSVGGGASIHGVSAGQFHACGVGLSGEAVCWGRANLLQLGSTSALETCGGGVACRSWPAEVFVLPSDRVVSGFRQVSAGGNHTCGLTQDDFVVCWGHNEFGQLGLGGTSVAEFPSSSAELIGMEMFPGRSGRTVRVSWRAREVAAGGAHNCAIARNGALFCWGGNEFGQVGSGTDLLFHLRPVVIQP